MNLSQYHPKAVEEFRTKTLEEVTSALRREGVTDEQITAVITDRRVRRANALIEGLGMHKLDAARTADSEPLRDPIGPEIAALEARTKQLAMHDQYRAGFARVRPGADGSSPGLAGTYAGGLTAEHYKPL